MERNFELLKEVLSIPTKTYQEGLMVEFIVNWLDKNNIPCYVDQFNNVYATKQTDENISYFPCVVAHTDTVHNLDSINVISIGVGNNMIFDEGMASLGASVYSFDHTVTPKVKKKYKNKIKHFRIGVRGDRSAIDCLTLPEIYGMSLGLNEFQKTILKIDCEGAEWDVFNDNSSDFLSQFDQICVEFHDLDKISIEYFASKYFKVFKKLKQNFVITYIVANNFTPIVKLKNGMSWPFTVELHLLNRKNLQNLDQNFVNKGLPNELSKTSSNRNLAPTYDMFEWYLGN